jgi:plasmid replication initiation protein
VRKFLSSILKKITSKLDNIEPPVTTQVANEEVVLEEHKEIEQSPPQAKKVSKNKISTKKTGIVPYVMDPIRDVIDLMEFPFLALSKNRRSPIIYESPDGTQKIKISRHTGHFLASIYDWDIVLVIAGQIQKVLNNGSDIPPRNVIIPRHELLKALHKQDGKKQQKDLEKSLDRLKMTGISTTVNNKDYRHRAGFGFIDSWGYIERKNNREMRTIQIELSKWLYELCCARGALLKTDQSYFQLTSGLKRFLYRTARKHAGKNKDGWKLTVETLYEKSGSEQEFKKFKSDLKSAVKENSIPEYALEWVEKDRKSSVLFKRPTIHELDILADKIEKEEEKTLSFNNLKENEQ